MYIFIISYFLASETFLLQEYLAKDIIQPFFAPNNWISRSDVSGLQASKNPEKTI